MDRMLSSTSVSMGATDGSGTSATTWAALVQEVEHSKKNLPWQKDDFKPSLRVPLPERKRMERALDPIAMKWRDPAAEASYTAKKMDRTETKVLERLNTIRTTQFNIINHTGPPRNYDKVIAEVAKVAEANTSRANNLLSHLSHAKQTSCPLLYDDEYMNKHMPPRRGPLENGRPGRDFNVINNQFGKNHEQMIRADYENMKRDMVQRYWENHDYNVITCEYYDDGKEGRERAKDVARSTVHGAEKDQKLPKSYFYSEGKAYDILTLETKDQQKVLRALSQEVKKDNRLSKFKGYQVMQVEAGKAAYDKVQSQHIARVGYERWQQEISRGYDFVNTGPSASATFKPLPQPKAKPWEKVHDAAFVDNYLANSTAKGGLAATVNMNQTASTNGMSYSSSNAGNLSPQPASDSQRNTSRSQRSVHDIGHSARDSARGGEGDVSSARYSARSGGDGSARGGPGVAQSLVPKSVPALDLTKTASAPGLGSVRTGGLSGFK